MYSENDPVVKYYDFSLALCPQTEIDFYVNAAAQGSEAVVDLCCGTGILTLELTKRIQRVYAVDNSAFMLQKIKEKMGQEYPDISIIKSDMNVLCLPEKADAVVCRDAFFHNLTAQNQKQTLQCVNTALNNKGIFLFNIHVPNPYFLAYAESNAGKEYHERGQFPIPGTNQILTISQALRADLKTQQIETLLKYVVNTEKGEEVSVEYSGWKTRFTYPYEMFYLLELTGFRINKAFGDYQGNDWNMNTMLIIEAEKINS